MIGERGREGERASGGCVGYDGHGAGERGKSDQTILWCMGPTAMGAPQGPFACVIKAST